MKRVKSEMRQEYDFSGAVRGKYAARYNEGVNIVKLDGDVFEVFKDEKTVNDALRLLIRIAKNKVSTAC